MLKPLYISRRESEIIDHTLSSKLQLRAVLWNNTEKSRDALYKFIAFYNKFSTHIECIFSNKNVTLGNINIIEI